MEQGTIVVYLAGKITGDELYKEKFNAAESFLRRTYGVTVLNPAREPEGLTPRDYMRLSFAKIDAADIVAFLPDWEESSGATLEMQYCRYIGKRTMQFPGDLRSFADELYAEGHA